MPQTSGDVTQIFGEDPKVEPPILESSTPVV